MKRLKQFVLSLISLVLLSWSVLPAVAGAAVGAGSSAPTNLIANPSVETTNAGGTGPANWTPNSWGSNTTTLSYANTGHTGSKSVAINMSGRTSGDAKWIPDAVTVSPSTSYVYSDYYESSVATELDAEYIDGSGNVSYAYLASVPASASWAPVTTTFTTPANAAQVSVLHILAANGSLQADDFSLTTNSPVTPPPNTDGNLILNPSFQTASGNSPVDWKSDSWGTNNAAFTYITNDGHTDSYSALVNITSYTSGDAKWDFNPVTVSPSTQYTFSDFYKSSVATSLVAAYTSTTGAVTYQSLGSTVPASSTWQPASVNFTTPANVSNVTIYHLINSVGSLQIDDASLVTTPVVVAPTVNITAPTNNATVSGNVTVSANASAAAGVKNVQFMLDGTALGSPVTTSPYQTTWNTSTALPGTHTLSATVTDNNGTTASATPVTVTVASATGNLMPNPSVETVNSTNTKLPLGWTHGSWGTNTVSFSYLTTGHTGTRSLKTTISSYTNGAAYWLPANSVPVVGGQMYDYSEYYESNVLTEVEADFTMSDGSVQYMYINDAFISKNSWTKFEAQFTAPAGAVSVSMVHPIYSVGWLTTDDFSLTPFSYQGFKRPIISITDDDGYASFYNNGLPILQKYGLNSTDYIISGYLDNTAGYMTSAQVKSLYAAGQEIGSHTVNHLDMSTLTATQLNNELKNSQTFLQNLLGVPIKDFAAPYGVTNTQTVTNAKQYYQSYRTVESGYNAKNNFNPMNLQVQNLTSTTTLAQVQGWINEAEATNTWLVLVYHQVDSNPAAGDYNTYPPDFDAQMAAIKASESQGVAVETVSQALTEVNSQL